MANNFTSNFSRKIARTFLASFESSRVMSKNVNTQLLKGKFNPASGESYDFKRPTDYTTVRTAAGDITSVDANDIIAGKATGTVQNYFTSWVDYDEADEAIKMDQLDQLLAPMSTRMCTDIELDFAAFMMKNCGLLSGSVGTAASTWDHIALAGATMQGAGVPMDSPWYYAVNPYTQTNLASDQRSLGSGGSTGSLIKSAHEKATIVEGYAGFDRVMSATTLASYTSDDVSDRIGALTSAPDVTYVTAKDTMTQVLTVKDFGADLEIRAGEVIQIAGRNRLNLSTREQVIDAAGNVVLFTGTVTTAVTLSGTGTGTITITGPAIYEAAGAYNTVSSSPTTGDVLTIGAPASTLVQPNLFWHKDAFAIGSVPIKKLYSTDTVATTKDGLQFRISKGSDFLGNSQKVRIDFRPAYGVMNPFFAGQGFGVA